MHRNSPGKTRWMSLSFLGAVAFLMTGCATPPDSRLTCHVQHLPVCTKERVHVVFVNCPLDIANVGGVDKIADSVLCMGFESTHIFDPCKNGTHEDLADWIRFLRHHHPCDRIVIVGWSSGAVCAQKALKEFDCTSTWVDSFVVLDSCLLACSLDTPPPSVRRHVLIYRRGMPFPQTSFDFVKHEIDEWNHLHLPCHPDSYDALLQELLYQAGQIRASAAMPDAQSPFPVPYTPAPVIPPTSDPQFEAPSTPPAPVQPIAPEIPDLDPSRLPSQLPPPPAAPAVISP